MALGESEVLGQVRTALRLAREAGATRSVLHRMFESAVAAGKRVRTETEIARHPLSVPSIGFELATKVFGDMAERTILVLGAGETGTLFAEQASGAGVRDVRVANRTAARAEELASRIRGKVVPWEALARTLAEADVVVGTTSSPDPVISQSRRGKRDAGAPRKADVLPRPRDAPRLRSRHRGALQRLRVRSRRPEGSRRGEPPAPQPRGSAGRGDPRGGPGAVSVVVRKPRRRPDPDRTAGAPGGAARRGARPASRKGSASASASSRTRSPPSSSTSPCAGSRPNRTPRASSIASRRSATSSTSTNETQARRPGQRALPRSGDGRAAGPRRRRGRGVRHGQDHGRPPLRRGRADRLEGRFHQGARRGAAIGPGRPGRAQPQGRPLGAAGGPGARRRFRCARIPATSSCPILAGRSRSCLEAPASARRARGGRRSSEPRGRTSMSSRRAETWTRASGGCGRDGSTPSCWRGPGWRGSGVSRRSSRSFPRTSCCRPSGRARSRS